MSTDRRLDNHENRMQSIDESIREIKDMVKHQSESQITLSEAVVKMSTQLEMLTDLSRQSQDNSERLYKEEQATALIQQQQQQHYDLIMSIKDNVDTSKQATDTRLDKVEKSQIYNKLVIGIIVTAAGLIASAFTSALFKFVFGI